MELAQAKRLIEGGVFRSASPQRWADLGAGEGLFTRALASLLAPNSSILALDRDTNALRAIKWDSKSVALRTQVADFTTFDSNETFDGIIIANALHYEGSQMKFMRSLKSKLQEGRLIVVEYERHQPNAWVPYPIGFNKLRDIAEKAGFSSITRLAEFPSIYDNATIYSAVLI